MFVMRPIESIVLDHSFSSFVTNLNGTCKQFIKTEPNQIEMWMTMRENDNETLEFQDSGIISLT